MSAASTTSLRRTMLWTLGGNVVFAASQWGTLVVLARLGRPSDVGLYTLGLAVVTPAFLLLSLQLRGAQATETQSSPYRFGHYFTLRALLSVLALIISVVGAWWFARAGGAAALAWVTGALALAKFFDGLSDVCYGSLQAQLRLREVALSLAARGLLSLLLGGLAFALSRQVAWAAAGTAAAYLGALLLYDLPRARAATRPALWRPERAALQGLARLTWPLGVAVGLIALNASLPRYFLQHSLNLSAVGVFSALSYVTVAGSMMVTALGQAATTPLARLQENGQWSAFRSLLARLLISGAVLGGAGVLAAALAGHWLLTLLYGPAYAHEQLLFTWLMVAAALSYVASFAGFGMTALRQFGAQVPLFLTVTASLLLSCALLIPAYGLLGAAWALLLSAVVQLAGSLWVVQRALRYPLRPASA